MGDRSFFLGGREARPLFEDVSLGWLRNCLPPRSVDRERKANPSAQPGSPGSRRERGGCQRPACAPSLFSPRSSQPSRAHRQLRADTARAARRRVTTRRRSERASERTATQQQQQRQQQQTRAHLLRATPPPPPPTQTATAQTPEEDGQATEGPDEDAPRPPARESAARTKTATAPTATPPPRNEREGESPPGPPHSARGEGAAKFGEAPRRGNRGRAPRVRGRLWASGARRARPLASCAAGKGAP
eukprot:scaffold637_cov322-Prasinococcus_capsulatus_cf.AAC.6